MLLGNSLSSMKYSLLWAAVVIVVIGAGGWWWYQSSAPATPTDLEEAAVPGATEEEFSGDPKDGESLVTVLYTDTGFVPSSVTVSVGDTVTFLDQSADNGMWVASDEHPTHTGYDGTNKDEHCPNNGTVFDQCAEGATYSFTFQKGGMWGYHNHRESDHHGTVIVR